MASGKLRDYLATGTLADRPATPDIYSESLALYYATDTSTLYAWTGSAWLSIVSGGSGVASVVQGTGIIIDESDPTNPIIGLDETVLTAYLQSIQEGDNVTVDATDPQNPKVSVDLSDRAPITTVATETGTALKATPANAWQFTRFTNAAAKTYTFDGSTTFEVGAEYFGRNVGAGDLTLAVANGFTINVGANSLTVTEGQTFSLKIVGDAEADLILYGAGSTDPPDADAPVLEEITQQAATTGSTSRTVTMPSTVNAGDLLIVVMGQASSTATITFASPSGWTRLDTGTAIRCIAYKVADGSEASTSVTFATTSSSTTSVAFTVFRIRTGTFSTTAPLASSFATNVTYPWSIPTPPSISGGWNGPNVLWISGACAYLTTTATSAYAFPNNRATVVPIYAMSTGVCDPDYMFAAGIGVVSSGTGLYTFTIGINPVAS